MLRSIPLALSWKRMAGETQTPRNHPTEPGRSPSGIGARSYTEAGDRSPEEGAGSRGSCWGHCNRAGSPHPRVGEEPQGGRMVLAQWGKLGMLGPWKQGCAQGGCGAGEEAERPWQPQRRRAGYGEAARGRGRKAAGGPGVSGRAAERLRAMAAVVVEGGSLAPVRGCSGARVSHGGTEAVPGRCEKGHQPCPQWDRNSLSAGKG